MERKTYRWCAVPQCTNTSIATPDKIFIDVPRKANERKKWFHLARRMDDGMSVTSPIYFCEDHFDLPNDMENYMRYRIMGTVNRIMLKPGCLPSKFNCQADRKRSLPSSSKTCFDDSKKQRLAKIQQALKESNLESNMEEEIVKIPPSTECQDVTADHQKTMTYSQDKCVQAFVKSKYFRSKCTQTFQKSRNIATSPSKTSTTTVSTSPFKVKENLTPERPSFPVINLKLTDESDVSVCTSTSLQPSSPSVQSLQFRMSSDTSSFNEEECKLNKEKEAEQILNITRQKIKAKPRLYIGITTECYLLVDLIHINTGIPTEHILLCLKKIRLNTTFSELADEFQMSTSYAGKIFQKNVPIISASLQPFIVELKKDNIKRTLPLAFRHRYNKVSCIIDCFEIEIEKPSKSLHQAMTWSEYKKGNTIKYLISSTPNGLVNYISTGYGGRVTDTLLVETCGFIEQLQPGSWVLADRGFKHIEQLLLQQKCNLLRPPSVVQGAKLTKQEVHETKQIASLRIHIERVIRRIREFTMLKPHSVLNSKLINVLDDCVVIACALINLQDGIVR